MPAMTSSRAPGVCAWTSRPAASGTSGSASPWMTSVGAVIRRRSGTREPDASTAASCRSVPPASGAPRSRSCLTRSTSTARGVGWLGLPINSQTRTPWASACSNVGRRGGVRRWRSTWPRPRHPVVARGRHDRGERSHPRRLPGRDDLAQHAAHRDAHQMHRPRAQVLEQAAQVIGHVVQQVGRAAGEPQPMAQVDPRHARAARQPAGLAHVAVVEAHHTQASLYQRTHERGRPCGQLLAQAVDQHQAAAHAVAARRVGDAQPTELTKLHIRGHETCLGTGSCGRKGWWLRHATGERERRSGWADKHGVTIGGHDARARRRETADEYGGAARRVGVTGERGAKPAP